MELIKAYKTQTQIEGLTKDVLIAIEVEPEHDIDLSYMDAKTVRKMERGALDCVWVKVTARFAELAHFEGVDSLGQVFCVSHDDLLGTVKDHDMAQYAIDDLIKQVLQSRVLIDQFLGKVA